jgi:hypothetical protein
MLLEDILLVVAIGVVVGVVGWPIYRFANREPWRRKSDPLAEAQERLRVAKLEAEAARLNRETERIYEEMYQEALDPERKGEGPRVAADKESPDAAEGASETAEKGKRHGQG